MTTDMNRRQFLGLASTAGALGLSGCAGFPAITSHRSPNGRLRHACIGGAACAPNDRQDWPAIVSAARTVGAKWVVVECEQRQNTFEDVERSAAFFRRLGV